MEFLLSIIIFVSSNLIGLKKKKFYTDKLLK